MESNGMEKDVIKSETLNFKLLMETEKENNMIVMVT